MKKLELSAQEIRDLKQALVLAMKEYDKNGDTSIAGRLDKIKDKVDKLEILK